VSFTTPGVSELVAAILVGSSMLLVVLTAAVRFGLRPLLRDWAKLRTQGGSASLERQLLEMEEDIRQHKSATHLQLRADWLRSFGHQRT
jgi:hypothetical protein